ncbi:hypothetical protein MMC10_002034 [Thelotrema lepadinum]|nr:hypothetical protein [Thelotrema lepadinum]
MALRNTVEAALAVGLMSRADVCGGAQGLSQCGNNFPSSFCCPSGTTCFGFNSNQGVICCPQDSCAVTNPLSCDIRLYNATANPASPFHLADLNVQLQPCGTNTCCPPGFTCNGNECVETSLLGSISASEATAKSTPAPTPTAVTGISASSTPMTTSSGRNPVNTGTNTNAASSTSSSSDQFPIQAILVGLLPGLVAGCLLAWLFICCLKRRKASKQVTDDDTSSLGPVAAKVSDPIYNDSATRTDFLRYAPSSRSPQGSNASTPISRVRSLFSKTPSLSPRRFGDQQSPNTPPGQIRREPSMESIKIYSPPDARFSRNTTFGDLLRAGGRTDNHSPPALPQFMGSPSMVDPRKRGVDNGNLR